MSTIRWKGLTGDWTVPSDWVDGSAPLSGDDVLFNTGGSYTATISTDVLAASVTFSDTGGKLVENAGASLTLSGTFTLTTGTVELDGSTSVGSFAQSGGTLSGSGTLTVTGAAQIAVGPNDNITQSGSGTTVLEDGGTLSGIATNALFLRDSRVLENEGTFAWQSTPIKILDSASIDNAAGATFDDQFDGRSRPSMSAAPSSTPALL